MPLDNAAAFPVVRRLSAAERGAVLAWAARRPAVRAELDVAEDGHELAALGLALPGDGEEDRRWFTLARFGRAVVVHSDRGAAVAEGRDVAEALAAFGRLLPGAPAGAA